MLKNAFVTAANGAQGNAIVKQLSNVGLQVFALVREEPQTQRNNVTPIIGDLDNVNNLKEGMKSAEVAVITLPLMFDKQIARTWVDNLIEAIKASDLKQIIFNASGPLPSTFVDVIAVDIKVEAANRLRETGVPITFVATTLYLGNLTAPWTAPAIMNQNVLAYPMPAAQKVAWTSWEVVGSAIVNLIGKIEYTGETIIAAGNESVDGKALSEAFSKQIQQPVQYLPVALADFSAGLSQMMGEVAGSEIGKLYHWLHNDGANYLSDGSNANPESFSYPQASLSEWIAAQDWKTLGANHE